MNTAWQFRLVPQLLACLCGSLTTPGVFALPASIRAQEMAQCLPGEVVTWGDGQDRPASSSSLLFVYQHAGAPPWFSEALVLSVVQKAASAWSPCGVPSRVVRGAAVLPNRPGTVLVQWSDPGSRGNFGLANLSEHTLSLSPSVFLLLNTRNPKHDARETLQMVISHEMGHHFGLIAHSRRCIDVTSYYNNSKGDTCLTRDGTPRPAGIDYRAQLPTACDIQRCIQANKAAIPLLAR